MSARIQPVTSTTAPEATRPILDGIKKAIGMVPNLYATIGHSAAALKGYLALSEALSGGSLSAREAELLALHVSELNGCSYCLSAHTALATRAGASPEDAAAAREGQSQSRRERAMFALARRIVRTGGARAGRELAEAREAGLTDGDRRGGRPRGRAGIHERRRHPGGDGDRLRAGAAAPVELKILAGPRPVGPKARLAGAASGVRG